MAEQSIEAMLAQYEMERAKIDIVIAALRTQLGQPVEQADPTAPLVAALGIAAPAPAQPPTPGLIRADEFFQMSMPEAIKRYLTIMKSPQPPKNITDALRRGGLLSNSSNLASTVWTALARLKDSGDLVNTPQGWGLADWYRGRAGSPAKEPKKRVKKKRKSTMKKSSAAKKGRASAKGAQKRDAPQAGAPQSWSSYLASERKAGRSMKEAAEKWNQRKQQQAG